MRFEDTESSKPCGSHAVQIRMIIFDELSMSLHGKLKVANSLELYSTSMDGRVLLDFRQFAEVLLAESGDCLACTEWVD